MTFTIPCAASETVSAKIVLNGAADISVDDFEIYVVLANDYGEIDKLDYVDFDGWEVSGQYTGIVLNETWNSESYSADWNEITMNNDGIAAIIAAAGGSLHLMLLSKEDYNSSAPENDEFVSFDSSADEGTEPYLSLTYGSETAVTVKKAWGGYAWGSSDNGVAAWGN